jgi:hypothetical protein
VVCGKVSDRRRLALVQPHVTNALLMLARLERLGGYLFEDWTASSSMFDRVSTDLRDLKRPFEIGSGCPDSSKAIPVAKPKPTPPAT